MIEARRTVCLVTPGHLSTNPRLVKEADALHEAGYRVEVIAARFARWADKGVADRKFDERRLSVAENVVESSLGVDHKEAVFECPPRGACVSAGLGRDPGIAEELSGRISGYGPRRPDRMEFL